MNGESISAAFVRRGEYSDSVLDIASPVKIASSAVSTETILGSL